MIKDRQQVEKLADEAISAKPKLVEDVKAGKEKAVNGLIGHVMAVTKGMVDPVLLMTVMREKLGLAPIIKGEKPSPVEDQPIKFKMVGEITKVSMGVYKCPSIFECDGGKRFSLSDVLNDDPTIPERLKKYILGTLITTS